MIEADTILAKLLAAYSDCETYQDTGAVLIGNDHPDESMWFRTNFRRGGPFRFEWGNARDPEPAGFVWFDGKKAYESDKDHKDQMKAVRSLSLALHRAMFGIFAGQYVPPLLLPEMLPDSMELRRGPYTCEMRTEGGNKFDVLICDNRRELREIWINCKSGYIERITNSRKALDESEWHREHNEFLEAAQESFPEMAKALEQMDYEKYCETSLLTIYYFHGVQGMSGRQRLRA